MLRGVDEPEGVFDKEPGEWGVVTQHRREPVGTDRFGVLRVIEAVIITL